MVHTYIFVLSLPSPEYFLATNIHHIPSKQHHHNRMFLIPIPPFLSNVFFVFSRYGVRSPYLYIYMYYFFLYTYTQRYIQYVCVCGDKKMVRGCLGGLGCKIILMSNICILFMAILLNVCFLISFWKCLIILHIHKCIHMYFTYTHIYPGWKII